MPAINAWPRCQIPWAAEGISTHKCLHTWATCAPAHTNTREILKTDLSRIWARVQHESSSLFVPWSGKKRKVFESAYILCGRTPHRRKCDVKSACSRRSRRSKTRGLFLYLAPGLWPLGKLRGLKTSGGKGCASLSESLCARACE